MLTWVLLLLDLDLYPQSWNASDDLPDGSPNPAAAVRFLQACRERGVLVGKGGIGANAVRISPPLTITREAAERAANAFEEALAVAGEAAKVG